MQLNDPVQVERYFFAFIVVSIILLPLCFLASPRSVILRNSISWRDASFKGGGGFAGNMFALSRIVGIDSIHQSINGRDSMNGDKLNWDERFDRFGEGTVRILGSVAVIVGLVIGAKKLSLKLSKWICKVD
jgi:hypothetical protein